MIEALKIPRRDRTLRVVEYAPDAFAVPPSAGPRYTLIEITLFSGRSPEAKKRLYRALVRNLELVGVPSGDVKIVLIEVSLENWGIRGGQPASEADLGFEVSI